MCSDDCFICAGCGRKFSQSDVVGPYCYSCIVAGLPDARSGDYVTPPYRFIQHSGKTWKVFDNGTREEVV